ncbi:hypothetical protein AALP_AA2G127300 [Arabis alpina]|uniref:Zinc knuckle CX2CX4HX4C domain-containing protein n=1 Tax=Arabis alpina TaxID=50452 RepID=A0A087HH08_ARAAL|nr:hypothetical protein AALP_AA2G127300 [Arabis alpina]
MVSLVRWEPSVAPDYPSEITFWARIKGLPFQYGAAESLMAVGELLGHASKVDVDAGFVRVTFNGFQPLIKAAIVPFDNGDEVEVQIDYERLADHCHHCLRLTHLASSCPELCVHLVGENDKKDEIIQKGIVLGSGPHDQAAWEFPQKKSVKRSLNQVDFAANDNSGNQREEERSGDITTVGQGLTKVSGRYSKRDSSHSGTSFRAKKGRANSYGSGRSGGWPAPLYKSQRDQNTLAPRQEPRSAATRDPTPVALDKGKGKEIDSIEVNGNVGLEDDDLLIEEGELGVDDFEFEDAGVLLAGNTSHGDDYLNQNEGEYGETGDFEGDARNEGEYGTENYFQERDGGSPEATG